MNCTKHAKLRVVNLVAEPLAEPLVPLFGGREMLGVIVDSIQIEHPDSRDDLGLHRALKMFASCYWDFLRKLVDALEPNNLDANTISSLGVQPPAQEG